jgi:hypothetical protein
MELILFPYQFPIEMIAYMEKYPLDKNKIASPLY